MSIMHFDTTTTVAQPLVVSLLGGTVADADALLARAGWEFRSNGFTYKNIGGYGTVLWRSDTDWITPRLTFDPADYEVRFERVDGVGSSPTVWSSSDTFGVWLSLASDRKFVYQCNRFCLSSNTCIADIRHATDGSKNVNISGNDGAPCMATAVYFIDIEAS